MNNLTEAKQVNVHPRGLYYFCPHCNNHIIIEYKSNYCPDCGNKLLWNDVNEFRDITDHRCYYEDTDERCKYYRKSCTGSKECNYVLNNHILCKHIGRLTESERRNLLFEKGWY